MIERHIELALTMTRLRVAVEDAKLRSGEVEALVGLPAGMWRELLAGHPAERMERTQERRARLVIELLSRLSSVMERPCAIRYWLTQPSETLDGYSPLAWAAGDVAHLHAMVVCLREVAR